MGQPSSKDGMPEHVEDDDTAPVSHGGNIDNNSKSTTQEDGGVSLKPPKDEPKDKIPDEVDGDGDGDGSGNDDPGSDGNGNGNDEKDAGSKAENGSVEQGDGEDDSQHGNDKEPKQDDDPPPPLPKSPPTGNKKLDNPTLHAIKTYLNRPHLWKDALEEEDVTNFSLKTIRYANERTRYRQNLLEDEDFVLGETFYDRVYREEESYALANDFFRNVVHEASLLAQAEEDVVMEKRTVNWLKKAAGLQRPYDPLDPQQQQQKASGSDSGDEPHSGVETTGTPRRMTRGKARNIRVQRRLERVQQETQGLRDLVGAITELETERGEKFPESKRFAKKSKRRSGDADGGILPSDKKKPKSAKAGEEDSKMSKKSQLVDQKIESTKERKRRRDREYQRKLREKRKPREEGQSSSRKKSTNEDGGGESSSDESEEEPEGRLFGKLCRAGIFLPKARRQDSADPVSLDVLDWRRRFLPPSEKGHEAYKALESLPPALVDNGIEYHPPDRQILNAAYKSALVEHLSQLNPPRQLHTDKVYASLCKKLVNSLSSGAKRWAFHEFFYSDIDRPWFNSNEFASDVASMGILPNTKLTRREWSMIRRQIPHRPRRFTRKFIFEELKKRNQYRSKARQLQRNPDQPNCLGFDVPAIIEVGATVTASSKRYGIVHRATVLFHDPRAHTYLVQFEKKELGCEICVDTDVARHGVPEILHPDSKTAEGRFSFSDIPTHLSGVGTLAYGAKRFPITDVGQAERKSTFGVLGNWIEDLTRQQRSSRPLQRENAPSIDEQDKYSILNDEDDSREHKQILEKAAERETLVSLMATIEAATTRKEMMLDALEKSNILMVDSLPFGEKRDLSDEKSIEMEEHYAWLLANLELTNQSLGISTAHLKLMYSGAYSKTPIATQVAERREKEAAINAATREHCWSKSDPPTVSVRWATGLAFESATSGKELADKLCEKENGDGDRSVVEKTSAAATYLFLTNYCFGLLSKSDAKASFSAIDNILRMGVDQILQASVISTDLPDGDDLVHGLVTERSDAIRELKEALESLKAEAAFSLVKQSFDTREIS